MSLNNSICFLHTWDKNSIKQSQESKQTSRYIYQTPNHDGVWKNLRTINSPMDADYVIILSGNGEHKQFDSIPFYKKICFQREPKKIHFPKTLYQGDYKNHYHVATWRLKLKFKDLQELKIPEKPKLLSSVISGKKSNTNQIQRLQVAKELKNHITSYDFFGNPHNPLNYDDYCKARGLLPYKYSFCAENSSIPNYFTEKIIDCLLCWSKPLYWGCPNISKYFPEESYTWIDIYQPMGVVIKQIQEAIEQPINYDAIREARQLILYKYNIYPSIQKIVKS